MSLGSLQRLLRGLQGIKIESLGTDGSEPSNETGKLDPFSQTLRSEYMELLMEAIAGLRRREGEVLRLYDFEELSMEAVGLALGIGESRVSQIRTGALVQLRTRFAKILEQKKPRSTVQVRG